MTGRDMTTLPRELSYVSADGAYSIHLWQVEGTIYRVREVGYAGDAVGVETTLLFGGLLDAVENCGDDARAWLCVDYSAYAGNSSRTRQLLLRDVMARPSMGGVAFWGTDMLTRVAANLLNLFQPAVDARAFVSEAEALAHLRAMATRGAGKRNRLPAGMLSPDNTLERVRQWSRNRERGLLRRFVPQGRDELRQQLRQQREELASHQRAVGQLLESIHAISSSEFQLAPPPQPPDDLAEEDPYWTIYAALHLLVSDMNNLLQERERRADDLAAAKEAAEQANAARTEFLGTLSHELRTPLSAIVGLSSLLGEGILNQEQHRQLDGVQQATERLTRLVHDLLDFARVEAGAIQLAVAPFDLYDAVEEVLAMHDERAAERDLVLEWHCRDDLPRWVSGDRDRLQQVLGNLVDNALKYTDDGRVRVLVDSDGPGRLRFAVADTGRGIPADQLSGVFERFSRAQSAVANGSQGAGLGLAISRQLVELMGGALRVESREGEGTEFRFSLDMSTASEPAVDETGSSTGSWSADLEGVTVLLVEDDELSRYVARTALERVGCEVVTAVSGLQAVERYDGAAIDLVLMDCRLPGLDGYGATREIRRQESGRARTPIIALTAYALDGDRERALAAGMDGYIAKPVTPDRLVAALQRFVQRGAAPGDGSP